MYENITIVVPSFNHGKYLPDLFGRLNKLIDIGVKVYIIDDASKDNSQDIIT
ncbi:TPA: glycosyltransferase, partial [Vibrio diabolicus]